MIGLTVFQEYEQFVPNHLDLLENLSLIGASISKTPITSLLIRTGTTISD